jgi:hypothetical protein
MLRGRTRGVERASPAQQTASRAAPRLPPGVRRRLRPATARDSPQATVGTGGRAAHDPTESTSRPVDRPLADRKFTVAAGSHQVQGSASAPGAATSLLCGGAARRRPRLEPPARAAPPPAAAERCRLRRSRWPGRSASADLLEAALITAADTYEERKLPYLAHLLAALAFDQSLSAAHANQLLELAHALTYRQFVLLATFRMSPQHPWRPDLLGETSQHSNEAEALTSIRVDLLDLFRRGLVEVRDRTRWATDSERLVHGKSRTPLPWPAVPSEISPRDTYASPGGERLARLMRLDEVDPKELEELVLSHVRSRQSA